MAVFLSDAEAKMSVYILHLPWPPSVNSANNFGKKGYYPSAEKKAFFRDADTLYYAQRPRWFVKGPFTYHLTLNRAKRSPTMDGDNRTKYPLDFLQRVGLIENDKLAEAGSWLWGECEHGSMLSVFPYVHRVSDPSQDNEGH
jgi:Holliday junction resolvase RusA-like endonuclease